MSIIQFSDGTRVQFNGTPSQEDVEEVASQLQIKNIRGSNQQSVNSPPPVADVKRGVIDRLTAKSNPAGGYVGEAAKTAYNVLPSFVNSLRGVVTSPTNVAKTVAQVPGAARGYAQEMGGGIQGGVKAAVNTLQEAPRALTQIGLGVIPAIGKLLDPNTGVIPNDIYAASPFKGKNVQQQAQNRADVALQETQKTITEEPVQNILPLLMAGKAYAKSYGREAEFDKAIQYAAKPVTVPSKAVGRLVTGVARSLAAREMGVQNETVKTVTNQPKEFSTERIRANSRDDVVNNVDQSIKLRQDQISETGKEYGTIRASGAVVKVQPTWLGDSLKKNNWSDGTVSIDQRGVVRPAVKPTRLANISPSEQGALKQFMDVWGGKQSLTADEFLDGRKFLDRWSKWQTGVQGTDQGKALFRNLHYDFNQQAQKQIPGLYELDKKYGPERAELSKLQNDYLNVDGTLKDNASSKIANLTNKGREQVLARLEKISPGIGQQIRVMKAIEDINNASATKVGTYARGAIGAGVGYVAGGGGLTGVGTAIIGMVLTHPQIATQLIRAYGYVNGVSGSILNKAVDTVKSSLPLVPATNIRGEKK